MERNHDCQTPATIASCTHDQSHRCPPARAFAALPAPVVAFNKSHSGSRLLAALLAGQGMFMGGVLNESNDALPLVPMMEYLVRQRPPRRRAALVRRSRGRTSSKR